MSFDRIHRLIFEISRLPGWNAYNFVNICINKNTFQVAAIWFKYSNGLIVDKICHYSTITSNQLVPSQPLPQRQTWGQPADFIKKTEVGMSTLESGPARLVLEIFAKWALKIWDNDDKDPSKVILVGYNHWSFDDNLLLDHFANISQFHLTLLFL